MTKAEHEELQRLLKATAGRSEPVQAVRRHVVNAQPQGTAIVEYVSEALLDVERLVDHEST
jgi:hypothetical protein